MKYRKIMVPVDLPDNLEFRASNSVGEVYSSTDLAALFRKIAEDLDANYWQQGRTWAIDIQSKGRTNNG